MRLKLITLNVEHGGRKFDNILSFIKKEKPDIVTFQEVYDSDLFKYEKRFRAFGEYRKEFKEILPFSAFQSSCFFITEIEEGAEQGNAVFSKFLIKKNSKTQLSGLYGEIDQKGVIDFSDYPSILQEVELDVDGTTVNLYNIHGIWGFDGGDSERRINMANIISSRMKDKKNVILAGDTNFTKDAVKTIEIIKSSGVKSVFENSLVSTFNMKFKDNPGYATAAVDMIFVSNDMKVIKREMPKVDVSDHYPLTTILQIDAN